MQARRQAGRQASKKASMQGQNQASKPWSRRGRASQGQAGAKPARASRSHASRWKAGSKEATATGPAQINPACDCCQVAKDTPAKVQAFRQEMEPLRATLKEHKWLGGESLGYADIAAVSNFLVRSGSNSMPWLCIHQVPIGQYP